MLNRKWFIFLLSREFVASSVLRKRKTKIICILIIVITHYDYCVPIKNFAREKNEKNVSCSKFMPWWNVMLMHCCILFIFIDAAMLLFVCSSSNAVVIRNISVWKTLSPCMRWFDEKSFFIFGKTNWNWSESIFSIKIKYVTKLYLKKIQFYDL